MVGVTGWTNIVWIRSWGVEHRRQDTEDNVSVDLSRLPHYQAVISSITNYSDYCDVMSAQ